MIYRKEWTCCGSVTETDAWEPETCPFCTTPSPAPVAQPLTDEQIELLWPTNFEMPKSSRTKLMLFARAIERAHDIGG